MHFDGVLSAFTSQLKLGGMVRSGHIAEFIGRIGAVLFGCDRGFYKALTKLRTSPVCRNLEIKVSGFQVFRFSAPSAELLANYS